MRNLWSRDTRASSLGKFPALVSAPKRALKCPTNRQLKWMCCVESLLQRAPWTRLTRGICPSKKIESCAPQGLISTPKHAYPQMWRDFETNIQLFCFMFSTMQYVSSTSLLTDRSTVKWKKIFQGDDSTWWLKSACRIHELCTAGTYLYTGVPLGYPHTSSIDSETRLAFGSIAVPPGKCYGVSFSPGSDLCLQQDRVLLFFSPCSYLVSEIFKRLVCWT